MFARITFAISKKLYKETHNFQKDLKALFEITEYQQVLLHYHTMVKRHGAEKVNAELDQITLLTPQYPATSRFMSQYVDYLAQLNVKLRQPVQVNAENIENIPMTSWLTVHDSIQKMHVTRVLNHGKQLPTKTGVTDVFDNLKRFDRFIKIAPHLFNDNPNQRAWIYPLLMLLGPTACVAHNAARVSSREPQFDNAIKKFCGVWLVSAIAACVSAGWCLNSTSAIASIATAYWTIAATVSPILVVCSELANYNEESALLAEMPSDWDAIATSDHPSAQLARHAITTFVFKFGKANGLIDINLTQYSPAQLMNQISSVITAPPYEAYHSDYEENVSLMKTALAKFKDETSRTNLNAQYTSRIVAAFGMDNNRTITTNDSMNPDLHSIDKVVKVNTH